MWASSTGRIVTSGLSADLKKKKEKKKKEKKKKKRKKEIKKKRKEKKRKEKTTKHKPLFFHLSLIIIIIDNFCIVLFSGVPKLTALYNILQHFLSFTNVIHILMTTNNV